MKNKFSTRIAAVRKKSGMSQKAAAAKLGISQALLSHYEKGIRECGLDFVMKAAKVFNVSSDYLLGLTDRLPADSADAAIYNELAKKPKLYLGRNTLQNATDLLYSITARFGNPKMYSDLNNMLYSNVYMALQMFNQATAGESDDLFGLSHNKALIHSLNIQASAYEHLSAKLEESGLDFSLDKKTLKSEFSANFDSAISIIETVETAK